MVRIFLRTEARPRSGGTSRSSMMNMASSSPDERLRLGLAVWIELDEIMWRPGTADAEGNVFFNLFCRRVDGRFEPIKTGARDKQREVCDLLFLAHRQCDNFGTGSTDYGNNLLGAHVAVPAQGIVEHLAEPDSVVVGGLSPAAEGSFPRCLQRRCPFDKVGDRICNVEAQTQTHFHGTGDPLYLRCQNIVVLG